MRLEAPTTESEHKVDGGTGRDLEVLDRLVVAPALSARGFVDELRLWQPSAASKQRQRRVAQRLVYGLASNTTAELQASFDGLRRLTNTHMAFPPKINRC